MELENLTGSKIVTLISNLSPEEQKKVFEQLLPYYKKSISGQGIPQGIYDFIHSKHYANFLQKEGYAKCLYSGDMISINDAETVFRSFSSYRTGEKGYIGKANFAKAKKGGNIIFDELLKEWFTDRSKTVYDDDFNEITVANSHAGYKLDCGEWYSSTISRHGRVCSTKPLNFYAHGASPKNWPIPEGDTLGAEIEMLFPSVVSKLKFSNWVGQNYPGWACEYDGSLEDFGNAGQCGLELISPPLLLPDMNSQITEICKKAVELGGKGYLASREGVFYGMHVTIQVPKSPRSGPSRTTVASRYIATFNSPKLRQFWQLVARRKGESFNQYCPFKEVSLDDCLRSEQGDGDRHAHRRAVFVRNPILLETRIFRSNLSGIQVRANIEICDLVMKFCKSPQFSLDNIKNLYDFLHTHMSEDLRKCLYRPKNTPIRVLNDLMMDSVIGAEPELAELNW